VDVVGPASAGRGQLVYSFQGVALQGQLPAVFASQPVYEGRRRAEELDALDPRAEEPGGQPFGGFPGGARGPLRVLVGVSEHRQLGVRRVIESLAGGELVQVGAWNIYCM